MVWIASHHDTRNLALWSIRQSTITLMRRPNPAASSAIVRLARKLKEMLFGRTLFHDRPQVLSKIQLLRGRTGIAVVMLVRQHRNLFRNRAWWYVVPICNSLAPDYIVYFDANSWIQGGSLFHDSHRLSAEGAVQSQPRLGAALLGGATANLLPQSTAHLHGSSRL